MSIPRDFIDLLLAKIDLVDVINQQIPLHQKQKSGSNFFALCPFHQEKTASFSVSQSKQFYYCFGCGAHGNAIDFLMNYNHLSFSETIERLAHHAGMVVPNSGLPTKHHSLAALYTLMHEVAAYYYDQMRHSTRAIQYLKQRGISGTIAQQFQLGYAPHTWEALVNQFGKTDLDKKKLVEMGLIIKKSEGNGYYDRFRDRIMFPIHDHRGRVIGLGGRIIDQGEPKYLNSPETPLFQKRQELYGLYQILQSQRSVERILIVEGYMDVIALFQHGITYAVATLGTATSSQHVQRLIRHSTDLIFCFDGDTAGRNAAARALAQLLPITHDTLQIRFLFLPEGEDPDSLIRREGKEAFEQRIAGAHSFSAFFFQQISDQSQMDTIEGRAKFAALALQQIKLLPNGIFKQMLMEELAKRSRIALQTLHQQLGSTTKDTVLLPKSPGSMELPNPIRLAIALLIQHPELAQLVRKPLPQLAMPGLTLLNQLIARFQENSEMTLGMLLELWRDQQEKSLFAELAHLQLIIPETGIQNEFLGVLKRLSLQGIDAEIERLLAKAANQSLNQSEKIDLANWIATKKRLANNELFS